MRNLLDVARAVLVGMVCATAGLAQAAETTTYTYDALGRLKATSISGGPNASTATALCYDAAGNRVTFAAAASGGATCVQASTAAAAGNFTTDVQPVETDFLETVNGPVSEPAAGTADTFNAGTHAAATEPLTQDRQVAEGNE